MGTRRPPSTRSVLVSVRQAFTVPHSLTVYSSSNPIRRISSSNQHTMVPLDPQRKLALHSALLDTTAKKEQLMSYASMAKIHRSARLIVAHDVATTLTILKVSFARQAAQQNPSSKLAITRRGSEIKTILSKPVIRRSHASLRTIALEARVEMMERPNLVQPESMATHNSSGMQIAMVRVQQASIARKVQTSRTKIDVAATRIILPRGGVPLVRYSPKWSVLTK